MYRKTEQHSNVDAMNRLPMNQPPNGDGEETSGQKPEGLTNRLFTGKALGMVHSVLSEVWQCTLFTGKALGMVHSVLSEVWQCTLSG